MKAAYLLPVAALVTLAACGTAGGTAAPVVTVTATEPAPAVTVTESASPAVSVEDETPTTSARKHVVAERKTLPDVVGMNLQAAQDRLQAAGFYLLDDKDATGRGRFQVYDRNWVVTRQKPAAGRKVSTDALIVLYAKKYGE